MLGLGLNMASAATQDSGVNRVAPYANNYSAQLDGVDDIIPLGLSDAQLETLHRGNFSVSFWVRRKSIATTGYLFGFEQVTGSNVNAFSIRNLYVGSSYIQTSVKHYGDGGSGLGLYTPTANNWFNIAATVTAGSGSSRGTARFYVNGSEVTNHTIATGTNHAQADIPNGFALCVGARQTHDVPTYDGYIKANFDEVAIWDEALTASEITAIYNSGSTFDLQSDSGDYTSSSNLQYYYRFENNFSDTMGNAGDATNPSGGVIFQDGSTIATP